MAIIIDGIKYACGSCIRGHRVKKCNHSGRELVKVLKRGRQVSQCNHCRDLRKTNSAHVKCTCAISSAPNPINDCLCEIIHHCSCVASHLQEVKKHCTTTNVSSPISATTQDTELFHLLYNDLEKLMGPAKCEEIQILSPATFVND